jgi:hypothetical protein
MWNTCGLAPRTKGKTRASSGALTSEPGRGQRKVTHGARVPRTVPLP